MNLMKKPDRWDYKTGGEYHAAMKQYDEYKRKMNAIVGGTFATIIGLAALTVVGGSW